MSNRLIMAALAADIAACWWLLRQMHKREEDWADAVMWRERKAGSQDE